MRDLKKYYQLILEITPLYCRPFKKTVLIDIDPLDWERENVLKERRPYESQVSVSMIREISREVYSRNFKAYAGNL